MLRSMFLCGRGQLPWMDHIYHAPQLVQCLRDVLRARRLTEAAMTASARYERWITCTWGALETWGACPSCVELQRDLTTFMASQLARSASGAPAQLALSPPRPARVAGEQLGSPSPLWITDRPPSLSRWRTLLSRNGTSSGMVLRRGNGVPRPAGYSPWIYPMRSLTRTFRPATLLRPAPPLLPGPDLLQQIPSRTPRQSTVSQSSARNNTCYLKPRSKGQPLAEPYPQPMRNPKL